MRKWINWYQFEKEK